MRSLRTEIVRVVVRVLESGDPDADVTGVCVKCGATRTGVEPDACGYPCDECGAEDSVYGAEELALYLA